MDLIKMSRIQMYFWFICSAATTIMVIYLYTQNMVETWYFMLPVICLLLAFLRRWQFKRLSKSAAERDAKAGVKNHSPKSKKSN